MAKFCSNCGASIPEGTAFCPNCGTAISGKTSVNSNNQTVGNAPTYTTDDNDAPTWMKVVSFLVPFAGWIYWLVKRQEMPLAAKSCAKWAWIGFGITLIFQIISALLLDY